MRLIRGWHNLASSTFTGGSVVTLGSFDGVHLGHQALIRQSYELAQKECLDELLITFEPLPHEYFKPFQQTRLICLRDKLQLLQKLAVDKVLVLPFDNFFRYQSVEQFIKQLKERLNLRYLVIGNDFCCGYQRQGDYATLKQLAERFNFQVIQISPFVQQGERVSSSLIRTALQKNDLLRAAQFLGRNYRISGRIFRIEQNRIFLLLNAHLMHLDGVYNVLLHSSAVQKGLPGIVSFYNDSCNRRIMTVQLSTAVVQNHRQTVEIEFLNCCNVIG